MRAINRKLWRDLWLIRGQALAIALVIAGGVATFVMSFTTVEALQQSRDSFYKKNHFAQIFASLKRAPESLHARITEIEGVAQVDTRIVAAVRLEIAGFAEPVRGRLISLPNNGGQLLNQLHLRQGRLVDPARNNEVIVSEAFAEAHDLGLNDELVAIINGHRQTLRIIGVALSPDYIYQIPPGGFAPDYQHYGVLWMAHRAFETAYDMQSSFNEVGLSLTWEGHTEAVIDQLDRLLKPYGGMGAYARKDQLSHHYISQEIQGLEQLANILPVIFLAVAAFLLNVVMSRLVALQREQIAALKALGYDNREIWLHFIALVFTIVLIGVAMGLLLGGWLGYLMSAFYMKFFRFPFLEYHLRPTVVIITTLVSIVAALSGTAFAIRRAVSIPPAQAMRPAAPASYQISFLEKLGLQHMLSQPNRMILRNIERHLLKSLLSIIGIAFACALMMLGSFQDDAIERMVDVQFKRAQQEDLSVTFTEPASRRALHELVHLTGVRYAEPFRTVPVRLVFENHSYRTIIQGIPADARLHRPMGADFHPVSLATSGIVLTDYLGKILGVKPGDMLAVETLEGRQAMRQVPVAGFVSEYIGTAAYMEIHGLNRLMREGNIISGVYLAIDADNEAGIYSALEEMPRVAGVMNRKNVIKSFYETMGEVMLFFTFIATLLAGTVAFGVIYNNARIALSERSRELASLRILGFTQNEIAYLLMGELSILILAAIPLGFVIGYGLCRYLAASLQSEIWRLPLVIAPDTYALAATVVLASAGVSFLIIRWKLQRLDLIAELKSRE